MNSEKLSRKLLESGKAAEGWAELMKAFALNPREAASYSEGDEGGCGQKNRRTEGERQTHRLLKKLDAIICHKPSAEAYAWRGALRRRVLNYAGAVSDLEYAEGLGVRSSAVLTWLGEARWQMGQRDQGERDLKRALRMPCQAWNYGWYGRILLTMGKNPSGLSYLNESIAQDPSYGWSYAWRGEAKRQLGKLNEAQKDFNTALRLDLRPEQKPWVYTWRGLTFLRQKKASLALLDFKKAYLELPDYAPLLKGFSEALRELGKYRQWVEFFNRAVQVSPKILEHLYKADKIELEAMEKDLSQVLRAQSRHAQARLWRGFILMRLGRPQEAMSDLNEAAKGKEKARAFLYRGELLCRLGERAKGIEDLNRSIGLDEKNAHAWTVRAEAFAASGNTHRALKDLDKAVSLDRHHGPAFAQRGALRLLLGQVSSALADLSWALQKDSRQYALWVDSALAHQESGSTALYRREIKKALALNAPETRKRLASWAALGRPKS